MKLLSTALLLLPLMAEAVKEPASTVAHGRVLGKGRKGKMDKKKKRKKGKKKGMSFNRVATYPVCLQLDPTCNVDTETTAGVVVATADGNTLIYTDSETGNIGFVNIMNPSMPVGMGLFDVGGEPTSVAVKGGYVLVSVNTSADFVNTSGNLVVIEIETMTIVRTMDLGGQPDALAVSPDGMYGAVAIENERGDGSPPQAPPGFLAVLDLAGPPSYWTVTPVSLTGLPLTRFPTDPEPEYVDINSRNLAIVTLQENNAIAVVDLVTKTVLPTRNDAGGTDLDQIDTTEEGNFINQTESLINVLREPSGVTWIGETPFIATADEGDLDGGSRGFTIFNMNNGRVAFLARSLLEHLTARLGHYNDGRSENRGNEPENVAYGDYGEYGEFLFVGSERSGLVSVWDISRPIAPEYLQALPTGVGPEGIYTIPERDLVVVASGVDSRDDNIRSSISIYEITSGRPQYPTIISVDRPDGTPIPWGALSGLAAETRDEDGSMSQILYAVEDSFYLKNRMFVIDASSMPATIIQEVRLNDLAEKIAGLAPQGEFGSADIGALVNDDYTVNLDLEGIAVASTGGLWVVSEGAGTVGDPDYEVTSLNFLMKVAMDGLIQDVILLPREVNDKQVRYGFEGVAEGTGHYEGFVAVAFQRAWTGENYPRIGWYNSNIGTWDFFFYELDEPASQNGGWVGLSDIAPIPFGTGAEFLVLERDNQGGPDGAIKKIYRIDLDQETPGTIIAKYDVRDIVPDLLGVNGLLLEKIEGMAMNSDGDVLIVNDNNGVDDNSGETQLLNLGPIIPLPDQDRDY